MLILENSELSLEVLEPSGEASQARQGFRYARGGYIWQVNDRKVGPLLTGPEGPAPTPDPYNGHGLPESFRSREFGTARALTLQGSEGLILGVGTVRELADKKLELLEPAVWATERSEHALTFATQQAYGPWSVRVQRSLALRGRTVTSTSAVTNLAGGELDLQWFAHPFFPLTGGRIHCQIPEAYGIAENPGYSLQADHVLTHKRVFEGVFDGHFEPVKLDARTRFDTTLSHPLLNFVRFETDFVPSFCPVWGNGHTWSIEPYLARKLGGGHETRWQLTYTFGPPRP